MSELRRLLTDTVDLRAIDSITQMVDEQLAIMRRSIDSHNPAIGITEAQRVVTLQSRQQSNTILALITAIDRRQHQVIKSREQILVASQTSTRVTYFAGLVVALSLVVATFALLLAQIRENDKHREQLRELNESLEEQIRARTLELQTSREQYANIIASAMDGIITIDEHQNIIIFNQAAEAMFQIQAKDILGKPLDRLIPRRFHVVHDRDIAEFSRSNVTRRAMEDMGRYSASGQMEKNF